MDDIKIFIELLEEANSIRDCSGVINGMDEEWYEVIDRNMDTIVMIDGQLMYEKQFENSYIQGFVIDYQTNEILGSELENLIKYYKEYLESDIYKELKEVEEFQEHFSY